MDNRDRLFGSNRMSDLYDAFLFDVKIQTVIPGQSNIGTTSAVIRNADGARRGFSAFHDGDQTAIFVGVGTTALYGKGIRLGIGGGYEFNALNLVTATISAIGGAASQNLAWSEML